MGKIDKKSFAEFVKEHRMAKGLSQEELATKLNVSRAVVSKWERGIRYPNYEILEDLSLELGVTIQELYDGSKNEKKSNFNIGVLLIPFVLVGAIVGIVMVLHNRPVKETKPMQTSEEATTEAPTSAEEWTTESQVQLFENIDDFVGEYVMTKEPYAVLYLRPKDAMGNYNFSIQRESTWSGSLGGTYSYDEQTEILSLTIDDNDIVHVVIDLKQEADGKLHFAIPISDDVKDKLSRMGIEEKAMEDITLRFNKAISGPADDTIYGVAILFETENGKYVYFPMYGLIEISNPDDFDYYDLLHDKKITTGDTVFICIPNPAENFTNAGDGNISKATFTYIGASDFAPPECDREAIIKQLSEQ